MNLCLMKELDLRVPGYPEYRGSRAYLSAVYDEQWNVNLLRGTVDASLIHHRE